MTNAKIFLIFVLSLILGSSVISQNKMWGTTNLGGEFDGGLIFKTDIDGSNQEVIHSFDFCSGTQPISGLFETASGKIYGTASGTLFEYDPVTNAQKKIAIIPDVYGGFIEASDGYLYGVSYYGGAEYVGQIIQFNPTTGTVSMVADLTSDLGEYSIARLIEDANGKLYGTASYGGASSSGTIFEFDPTTSTITKKIDLQSTVDGAVPKGGLTLGSNNKYYGTSYQGGVSSKGSIFEYDLTNNTTSMKVSFSGSSGSFKGQNPIGELALLGDKVYGVTTIGGDTNYGIIFEYDYVNDVYTILHQFNRTNGAKPSSVYLSSDGKLYGSTRWGGDNDRGVLFEYDLNSSTYSILTHYDNLNTGYLDFSEGLNPVIIASNGHIYGTLMRGGKAGSGTLFEYNLTTSTFSKKKEFNTSDDGHNPSSSILQANNGKLYVTTSKGGQYNGGALFEIDPSDNAVTKKYDFDGATEGSSPQADLIQASNGDIYGVLWNDGINAKGAVYKYNISTETITIINTFDIANGAKPITGLEEGPDGNLYGVTREGGVNNIGVVYKIDPTSDTFTKLVDFETEHGKYPEGQVVFGDDGLLYGIATMGGLNGYGTIYAYDYLNNELGYVKYLGYDGKKFAMGLTKAYNGKLYGLSREGSGNHSGTLIEFNPADSSRITKVNFWIDTNGYRPYGKLSLMSNGNLYGYTRYGGGSNGKGIFFEYNPYDDEFRKIMNFNGSNGANPVRASPVEVFESNLPVITQEPVSKAVCEGSELELMVFTSGPDVVYQWKKDNVDIPGARGSSLKIEATTIANAGDYKCVIGNDYGLSESAIATITITTAPEITFDVLPAKTFGDAAFSLTSIVSNGDPVVYNSLDETIATVNGNEITIIDAGTVTLEASSTNSCFTTTEEQQLVVEKAIPDLSFTDPGSKEFGDFFNLVASSSSGQPIVFESSNPAIVSIAGSVATVIGVGIVDITASIVESANYYAGEASFNITSVKADQSITFNPLIDAGFDVGEFTLTATSSSGLVLTYTSSNEDVATVSGSIVTIHALGTTTLTASQVGNANYNAAIEVSQSLTVIKGNQTITFDALANVTYGDASFNLAAISDSGLDVTYTSSDESVTTISGNTIAIVGAGTASITAIQAGDDNYYAASNVSQTLIVNKADQTITFDALADVTYGDASFNLSATSDSGFDVTYTSSDENVAAISGNTITIVGAGTTSITATQAGDVNYNAALDVSQSLIVNKADQTVTFDVLADVTYGDASFNLSASTNSGFDVTYTSSDENVAAISGNTITIVGAGTTSITATQAGDDNYNAASYVVQSLIVNKADQTITFDAIPQLGIGDGYVLVAIASSGGDITFTSSDEAVASVSGNVIDVHAFGEVTIAASQIGDSNYNPAPNVSQVITINTITSSERGVISDQLMAYPNPVVNRVTIDFGKTEYEHLKVFNATGNMMEEHIIEHNRGKIDLDMSDYNQGLYFVQFVGTKRKKIIKLLKN